MLTKINYVIGFWPAAVAAGQRFGINPVAILAQGAQESAWGTSFSARNRLNHFGFTAFGKPNEFWKGQKSQSSKSGLWFRVYPTVQDGFMDFARLISSKYAAAARVSHDTDAYAAAIAASPYIHEGNGDDRGVYRRNVAQFAREIADIAKKKGFTS